MSGGRASRQREGVRKRGQVPEFWWDFTNDTKAIIVETTDPRAGPDGVVETFHLNGDGPADA